MANLNAPAQNIGNRSQAEQGLGRNGSSFLWPPCCRWPGSRLLIWCSGRWLTVPSSTVGSVKNLRTGVFAIPGFTAALPLAQIAYGALWSRLFGLSYPALDLSVASLGLVGSILFYWLARNCGADGVGAATGTALLIANPCYLFLSFSFMTDVPFVAALIAAHFMFANAERGRTPAWMWSCAGCLVVAFLVRPFALAAIAGCAGAIIMTRVTVGRVKLDARLIVPFVAALIVCIATWWWMTAMRPMPWMLELRGHKLSYVYLVPLRVYFIDAIIAPLLYLGLVLSPLALPHLFCPRWRTGLAVALGLAVVALPLLLMDPGTNSIPELSCCGGWTNVLVLRGPLRFVWTDQWIRTAVIVLGILGAAGMVLAALEIRAPTRGFIAVMLSAAIYWGGTIPLWMFNDRYYLVMVPAGCLLLAVAARRRGLVLHVGSIALLAALGWFALGGAYAYQRGLSTVIGIRNALLMNGVPRSALDAGYPLNGNDLYREAPPGERETHATEAGIPLITSLVLQQYTIAVEPLPDTVILKRFEWPGLWGIGQRPVYLLKRIVTTLQSVPSSLTARHPNAPGNRLPSRAVLLPRAIIVRLALMGLMMLAPTALVLVTFGLVPSPAFRRS